MTDLTVTVDDVELRAEWTDSNPETRAALTDALPVSGEGTHRWRPWTVVPTSASRKREAGG